jgi:integrase/recombinase XerD
MDQDGQSESVTEIVNVPARVAGDGHAGVPMSSRDLERLRRDIMPPLIVQEAGPNAQYAYADFFKARISNANTHKAYKRDVDRFLAFCPAQGSRMVCTSYLGLIVS